MELPNSTAELAGWIAHHFSKLQPLLPTYLHLLVSALLPIFAGAHSSLARPSSAAKQPKKKDASGKEIDDDSDEHRLEGLTPRDAILFPVLAGTTLAGLYFLIKWLQDPAILNKILNYYFATFSVFAVSKLVSDGLDVFHSFLFPHEYRDHGVVFRVDPKTQTASPLDHRKKTTRSTPLPGPFSRLPLPRWMNSFAWMLHVVPERPFRIRAYIYYLLKADVKVGIHGLEGLVVGLATVLYFNFVSKPWYLTNLMGFGFAYGSLQLISPTTFWTGTLILSGLFFYDIYFVFFTPMMVTVAQSIEIPAKLLFPRPADPENPAKRAMAMLGLGDIVLPGIMIGLALRFDLYMFYLRKQTRDTKKSVDKSDTKSPKIIKTPYEPVGEGWGDRFWTSYPVSRLLAPLHPVQPADYRPRNKFPKPYFHASMFGYLLGMLTTLLAMQVSDHPQPALLYLVPGVVGSLWFNALIRGEVKQMWHFSDDEEDEEAKKKAEGEKDAKSKASKDKAGFFSLSNSEARAKRMGKTFGLQAKETSSSGEQAADDSSAQDTGKDDGEKEGSDFESDEEDGKQKQKPRKKRAATLFHFSITAPDVQFDDAGTKDKRGQ